MASPKIPQFNSNVTLNNDPYRFARTFDVTQKGEANLYAQIWAESCFKHGIEVYYIEKFVGESEPILGEYLTAKLTTATRMFLQPENLNVNGGWQVPDIYTKFGLSDTNEETFKCPKTIFSQAKLNPNYTEGGIEPQFLPFYPKQGDLIYTVLGKKLWEIQHIETEVELGYIFGNVNAYQIKCKLYIHDHMDISDDSSIPNEVKALELVKTINGQTYNITEQELTNFNQVISKEAETIVDDTEDDALF